MSNKVYEEEASKNIKFMAFNLLRILKFFYSFKELEKRLGIPSQVLWRYVTLRVIPEKETAQRILARISEQKLVEEVVFNTISKSRELWVLLANPGILELAALRLVVEFKKNKVDVVIPTPDPYSIALAAIVSAHLRARLCIPSRTPFSSNIVVENYEVAPGILEAIALPRECISRKSKVIVVAATISQPHLKAVLSLVAKTHAEIIGVFTLTGTKQAIHKQLAETRQTRNLKIITLIEAEEQVNQQKH